MSDFPKIPTKAKILCGRVYCRLAEEFGFDLNPVQLWDAVRVGFPDERDAIFFLDLLDRDSRMRRAWVESFDFDVPTRHVWSRLRFIDGLAAGYFCALVPIFVGERQWILASSIVLFVSLFLSFVRRSTESSTTPPGATARPKKQRLD
jgi:hypothetical protein